MKVLVGYSEPFENRLAFNFHIRVEDHQWTEVVDYYTLGQLDNTINRETDEFRHIQFLSFGNDDVQKVIKSLVSNDYNIDTIKSLERHRKIIQVWINFVFDNVFKLDDECRQLLKQLFFLSVEKIACYERHFFNSIAASKDSSSSTSLPKKMSSSIVHRGIFNKKVKFGTTFSRDKNKSFILPEDSSSQKRTSIFGGTIRDFMSDVGGNAKLKTEPKPESVTAAPKILKVEVQRGHGGEGGRGVLTYEINLRVRISSIDKDKEKDKGKGKHKGKQKQPPQQQEPPVVHTTHQRYSNFKKFMTKLFDLNAKYSARKQGSKDYGVDRESNSRDTPLSAFDVHVHTQQASSPYENFLDLITAPFPFGLKSYLGISLNDTDLSERTRMLDSWMRDICYHYRYFPPSAKELVRNFLNFDMTEPIDILVQDQLHWGKIEAPRSAPHLLIMQQSVLQGEGVNGLLAHMDGDDTSSVAESFIQPPRSIVSFQGVQNERENMTSMQATIRDTMSRSGNGSNNNQGNGLPRTFQVHRKAGSVV